MLNSKICQHQVNYYPSFFLKVTCLFHQTSNYAFTNYPVYLSIPILIVTLKVENYLPLPILRLYSEKLALNLIKTPLLGYSAYINADTPNKLDLVPKMDSLNRYNRGIYITFVIKSRVQMYHTSYPCSIGAEDVMKKPRKRTTLKENIGKYFLDVSKLILTSIVLSGILRREIPQDFLLTIGIGAVIVTFVVGVSLTTKEIKTGETEN